jgi:hypothetical protein
MNMCIQSEGIELGISVLAGFLSPKPTQVLEPFVNNNTPLDPILTRLVPIRTFTPMFFDIHLNTVLPYTIIYFWFELMLFVRMMMMIMSMW